MSRLPMSSVAASCSLLLFTCSIIGQAHADSMSALIAQKSVQSNSSAHYTSAYPAVPSVKVSTHSTIQRANSSRSYAAVSPTYNNYSNISNDGNQSTMNSAYRYPEVQRQSPAVLPAFLSGSYDNVDSEYLPLLSSAETQSSMAAREVVSTARKMALNERTIIKGGCWDYLNAVFNRAGVSRNTIHKGTYAQGPYASSSEIEAGDWLYYINHGYNGIEHSGLFVGWVDERAKQALILSYAGENRREPARYRVYDLSNVYQIMRPSV
ncbi:hypothetical protein [Psychrobacter piscatorii]|uniref:hypothetical protein n=1 Tax=Psychrobacter piscatorii TaxID=554343 RepID=UPI0019193F48|nr:hypothetical protein [Psychrobacter piscatorii]